MASQNRAVLNAIADTNVNDNTTGDVSPQDVRTVLKNLADSCFNLNNDDISTLPATVSIATNDVLLISQGGVIKKAPVSQLTVGGGGGTWGTITGTLSTQTDLQNALNSKLTAIVTTPLNNQVMMFNGTNWVNTGLVAAVIPNLDASKITTGTFADAQIASAATWNGKENAITSGTTAQYFRGDKTFQTLDKSAVGLSNVDNISDVNKPVSTATQTALNLKQNTLSLTTTGTAGVATLISGVLNIPQYAAGGAGTVTSVTGTGTVSGLNLSGTVTNTGNLTLGGTLAVTPSNFASQTANTVLAAPAGVAGVPTFRALVGADIPTLNQNTTGTAANVTGTVSVANGGTGATTAGVARTNLGLGSLATLATVGTSEIANSAVTYAKMQNVTTARIMGRLTAGAGVMEELSGAQALSIIPAPGANSQILFNNNNVWGFSTGMTWNNTQPAFNLNDQGFSFFNAKQNGYFSIGKVLSTGATNLSPNRDFNTSVAAWLVNNTFIGGNVTWNNGLSGNGSNGFMRFNSPSNADQDRWGASISLEVSKSYTISFWYRYTGMASSNKMYLIIAQNLGSGNFFNGQNLQSWEISYSTAWVYHTISLTTNAGISSIVGFMRSGVTASGTFDVDQIDIYESVDGFSPAIEYSQNDNFILNRTNFKIGDPANKSVEINLPSTTVTNIVVTASTSQTADLAQFRNNAGMSLVRITPSATVFMANATTVPSSNPSGGGVLYVEGGALKYRGSSGTITTLGNT